MPTGEREVSMPVLPAEEDLHWYCYNDAEDLEKFACNMDDCRLRHKGYSSIGCLNVHMRPVHKLKASSNHRWIPSPPTDAPPPAITQSADKRVAKRAAKDQTVNPPPKRSTGSDENGKDSDGGRQRLQQAREWTEEYKAAMAPRNARMAFAELKLSLTRAINWLGAITKQNEVNAQRWIDYKGKMPMDGDKYFYGGHSHDNSESLSTGRGSKEDMALTNDLVLYNTKVLPSDVIIALRPHDPSSSHAGGRKASEAAICLDLQRRKALCRAIAAKLRHPKNVAATASPEMVRQCVNKRPQLPKPPVLTNTVTGDQFIASHVNTEAAVAGLEDDIHTLEVEENEPIAFCKPDPKSLMISPEHGSKGSHYIANPMSPFTMFSIDHHSPGIPASGSSVNRPIVIRDSPTKTGVAVARLVGALNQSVQSNANNKGILVSSPKGKISHTPARNLPPSPPSIGCLLKDIADSALARISGSSVGSHHSKVIEELLGQVDNVATIPVGQAAPPTTPENMSQLCNLSTQSIQWILDELEVENAEVSPHGLVNYASDSEEI